MVIHPMAGIEETAFDLKKVSLGKDSIRCLSNVKCRFQNDHPIFGCVYNLSVF